MWSAGFLRGWRNNASANCAPLLRSRAHVRHCEGGERSCLSGWGKPIAEVFGTFRRSSVMAQRKVMKCVPCARFALSCESASAKCWCSRLFDCIASCITKNVRLVASYTGQWRSGRCNATSAHNHASRPNRKFHRLDNGYGSRQTALQSPLRTELVHGE